MKYLLKTHENPVIKLDLDSQESLNEFINRIWIIKNLGLKVDSIVCYDTRHGYHIYLYLDNILTNFDMLIIESLLGSDFRKQLYNYLKMKNGTENWDILFEEKYVFNHLGHRICLSKEELNQELSDKIMNLISFGTERNTGIFMRKPGTEEGKKVKGADGIDGG